MIKSTTSEEQGSYGAVKYALDATDNQEEYDESVDDNIDSRDNLHSDDCPNADTKADNIDSKEEDVSMGVQYWLWAEAFNYGENHMRKLD